jgi:BirA family transcriptional regulator, biotin operon repressor / biotin---[acetyl-CoA-carboxylase] ligase
MDVAMNLARVKNALTGPAAGWDIRYKPEVNSTMDVARQLAMQGAPHGTVALAGAQTSGRGRLGRSWVSEPDTNLYFTVVLRPSLTLLSELAMVTPLAVAEAIEQVTKLRAEIKWPNDVQIDGLKCCGVLLDSEVQGNVPRFCLAGIGINVNSDPGRVPELAGIATSVAIRAGREISREDLLGAVLSRLAQHCLAVESGAAVQHLWKSRLNTLGRSVNVRSGADVHSGVVEDVTEEGTLKLRRDDGSIVSIPAGEVTLRT